jgi:hypothetical protein
MMQEIAAVAAAIGRFVAPAAAGDL